jgi:hypothetical protein
MTLYTKEKIKLMSLFLFTIILFVISTVIMISSSFSTKKDVAIVSKKQDIIINQFNKSNFSTND